MSRVTYLGHIVSKNSIETDPKKIEAIKRWPVPKTVTEVQNFLGFMNYYRKFIPKYVQIDHLQGTCYHIVVFHFCLPHFLLFNFFSISSVFSLCFFCREQHITTLSFSILPSSFSSLQQSGTSCVAVMCSSMHTKLLALISS